MAFLRWDYESVLGKMVFLDLGVIEGLKDQVIDLKIHLSALKKTLTSIV